MQEKFIYKIANFGSAAINSVEVGIIVNNEILQVVTVDGVPAGMAREVSFTLVFPLPGIQEVGYLVDPKRKISDPTRDDNLMTMNITVRPQSLNEIRFYKAGHAIPMVSTDHGLHFLFATMQWSEFYSVHDNYAIYSYRMGATSIVSSRSDSDTPYTAGVNAEGVTARGSSKLIMPYPMKEHAAIWPTNLWFSYCKECSVSLALNQEVASTRESGFTLSVVGNDGSTPMAYSARFTVPLNFSAAAPKILQVIPDDIDTEIDQVAWNKCYQLGKLERELMEDTDSSIALRGKTIRILNKDYKNLIEQNQIVGVVNPDDEARRYLLRREALFQLSLAHGCSVSDSEVHAFLSGIKFAWNRRASNEGYGEAVLKGAALTPDEYFERLFKEYQKDLVILKYTKSLRQTNLVDGKVIKNAMEQKVQLVSLADTYIENDNVQNIL